MKLLVIGAAGDVGQGLVYAAVERGWSVAAAGRDADRLKRIIAAHPAGQVRPVIGSVADPAAAAALLDAGRTELGGLDAVIVSVNAPNDVRPLSDWTPDGLLGMFAGNVITHFNALTAALDVLNPQGVFLGIGGGTADFVRAGSVHISMGQAALRMMYRGMAKEQPSRIVRELQIVAMVDGESTRHKADDTWLKAEEIGRHACAIIERPAEFSGPIVILRRQDPIGTPPAKI